MQRVNEVASLSVEGGIATLTLDSPPVNALSAKVRTGLVDGFRQALADPEVIGIILICAGRTFFAGADISEFDKVPEGPDLDAVEAVIEGASKPVVAAIHGTALGGGLEVALTCHYRVAVPSAKVGLPEVALGLLPGAGGTQRLPRIVGAAAALDMIAFGRPLGAPRAVELGLIDGLVEEGKLLEGAVAFLRNVVSKRLPLKRVRDADDKLADGRANPGLFDEFRARNAGKFRGFKAPENIIRAVEAAVTLPFDEGMKRERELFFELFTSTESAAQRYAFFAERQVAKIPDVPSDTPTHPVASVGVIGAGTRGAGIAMAFLNIGLSVTIVEQQQDALDRGVAAIRRTYETTARDGRFSKDAVEKRMALLRPTLNFAALGEVELIIEAVTEDLDLKKQVFSRLDRVAAPNAILASTTSLRDLDAIAAATSRPERVIGMHFFAPADAQRLVEVVRGEKTARGVIATAMQIGRKIGKVAVLSRVGDGFIANRMMATLSKVANKLILEGPMPRDIDRVMVDFGFPMGPFATADRVGLDLVGWNPDTSSSSTVLELLCEAGRVGQKANGGFYDYDERGVATASPAAEQIIRDFADTRGVRRRHMTDREILERLLFPVVKEGVQILEEGVALRASDIDVALMTGCSWPIYTGGPLFWADRVGLDRVVAGLDEPNDGLASAHPPSPLLRKLAADGRRLQDI